VAKSLEGKVALVTGASSGIGRAAALALAQAGAGVVVSARREREGEETARAVERAGAKARFVRADVADEVQVRALVEATLRSFGRLDCAFNNAGIEGTPGALVEATGENFDRVFGTNVKGLLFSLKYEIPAMITSGGGAIVNCASTMGQIGYPGVSVYGASKGAVIALTRHAAIEYAKSGVRVNAIAPGGVHTEMIERLSGGDAAAQRAFAAQHALGRLGTPDEIARAVVFLCSDAATFVTGQTLSVDGGYTAQ
jgi:NAD(P)-dependent dehydrogenase (short-subunit alcohol dehydrogenase family)